MTLDDQIRAMAEAGESSDDQPFASAGGFLGQVQAIGLGYLTRRVDIDLSNRLAQPGTASTRTAQKPIDLDVRATTEGPRFNMQHVLMAAGAAVVLLLVLKAAR